VVPAFWTNGMQRAIPIGMKGPAFVFVDKYGRRFMDEGKVEAHLTGLAITYFDPVKTEYPRMPCFLIFDSSNFAFTLSPHSAISGEWSKDNSLEVQKEWIIKSTSIEELAEKLDIARSILSSTIGEYNNACYLRGTDPFGRSGDDLMSIDKPPHYAVELWPAIINTQGGPKRNGRCHILDPYGKPIKRLYSAGELGSIWGNLYQSDGNLSECLATGRIAGREASNESRLN